MDEKREEERVVTMIVSGESKTGPTHGRICNPWRLGESDARSREPIVEQSFMSSRVRDMTSAPIVVDDEDDDVVVSSPRAFAQAKLIASIESRRSSRHQVLVEEDPLALRLGPGGTSQYSVRTQSSITQPLRGRRGRPARATIDLTIPSRSPPVIPLVEDCVLLNDNLPKSRKRKNVLIEQSFMQELAPTIQANEPEGRKFKCAICMDTMKEETSTICGHIFCQSCIQGAINAQKRCPTCRRKLTMKNVHRIYI
ncbi:uncharacterized protein [Physcomitrium patens]|uniref:RING-type domain-containing protein n=1 Tax=Physcomitrium patens TaxID=3218 RepID=A0A2K1IRQ9_PHYPA|nr:E3 ubiquitin-protein ligase RNF4-like [Physcomitrium patens]PNR31964.1 hypothetical protein PHYPA_026088 [Physcomitrium patens]|eukprot:XP_024359581.1 E3 ubiquitin-protein ligase RNF4-like [Physcomitrella patens]